MTRFVKAATTGVPVMRSQSELERILRRYGATGFGVSSDYDLGIVRVSFRVPDVPGGATVVPVRLEISIEDVFAAMNGQRHSGKANRGKQWEQAERVAWRHLVVWVDAALSAASAGMQKMSEAFLAHVLVHGENGQVLRIIDQLNGRGEWRALLPSGVPALEQESR